MIFAKKERVAGREDLKNYGPFRGATYFCEVSPVDAPEQIATAVVSQTGYQDVRDDYAIYYFEEDAVALVLTLCGTKDYVIGRAEPKMKKTIIPIIRSIPG